MCQASERLDQRGKEFGRRNSIITEAMEKKFYNMIIDGLKKQRFSIIINPRMLVSERKNPIEETYEVMEVIGAGGYGEVKKVRHKELDVIRALKTISKNKYKTAAEVKIIKNEIQFMKAVDHPNIVKLFEFFEDDENEPERMRAVTESLEALPVS